MPKVTNAPIEATTVPGPRGPICLAASSRGVVAIDLMTPPDDFARALERRFGRPPRFAAPDEAGGHLAAAVRAIGRYLGGDPRAFEGLSLDLADRPAWDRAVLAAVREVPWGTTSSYGRIATAIGRRGAARAVGGAVGRNPVSLAIPCHRVIAGDGTLGGYGGGWWGTRELYLELKRELLAREGTAVRATPDDPRAATIEDSDIVAQATLAGFPPR